VDTQDKRLAAVAETLIHSIGEQIGSPTHILHLGKNGIELRSIHRPGHGGFRVDFSTIDRRTGGGNLSRRQTFPKAIGERNSWVVDATAGFGADSARLALMGYRVTAIERSPIIVAMLQDGLFRACQDKMLAKALGGRLTVIEANATRWLLNNKGMDVVYLDPMFPPKRKKSALPPGHIQLLQSLVVAKDAEADRLFQVALQAATRRVVVKRPSHAPHMAKNPVAIHEGKLVRYEVYRPPEQDP